MNSRTFLGFKQNLLSTFVALSDDEKKGYLWLVRDDVNEGSKKCQIYLGTKLYAETNDGSADIVLEKLANAFGGLLDENGDFVGLPYEGTGTTENHPILSQDADNLLDILKNIEAAIIESNANNTDLVNDAVSGLTEAIEALEGSVEANAEAIEAINEELAKKANADDVYTKEEIDGKIAGVWHFKGTKESMDELNAIEEKAEGDVYQIGDKEYAWNGTEWIELGFNVDLSTYATKEDVNEKVEEIENTINDAVSGLTDDINDTNERVDGIEERVETLEEKSNTSVDTMEEAQEIAKAENQGQIIYINNKNGDTGYTAGAYVVTGEGTVAKLGTTTATGDVEGEVNDLIGRVTTVETKVETIITQLTIDGDDVE